MSPVEKDPAAGLNGAVAATFRGERGALGMTFDELAERSGVPVRSLMRFLNAQRHMDMSVVEAIAQALSMTPAEAITAAQARLVKSQPDYFFVDEKTGRTAVVELKSADLVGRLDEAGPQVRGYTAALLTTTNYDAALAEALNERLEDQRRVDPDIGRQARIFITYAAGSGKTASMLAALTGVADEPFDLRLTEEDRAFLEEIRVGDHANRPKAARKMASAGRAARVAQDEAAEVSQDDGGEA